MEKRSSWQIQKAVFHALFVREMKTRFGGYRLGYFWALIEPLSHIIVLSLMFSLVREKSGFFGVPFPIFFATGILAFFLFRKIVMTSQKSISVNLSLFGYRQVKPFDAILVRAFIEGAILVTTVLVLAWLGAWFFKLETFPVDPLKASLVLTILFFFGLGVGFFSAVVGALHDEWAQFIGILMRPLYFLSGILFPLPALPEKFHVYLLWNPLLHGVEQFRLAWIDGYPEGKTSIFYLLAWTLPALFFGLMYYRNNRIKVLMS